MSTAEANSDMEMANNNLNGTHAASYARCVTSFIVALSLKCIFYAFLVTVNFSIIKIVFRHFQHEPYVDVFTVDRDTYTLKQIKSNGGLVTRKGKEKEKERE